MLLVTIVAINALLWTLTAADRTTSDTKYLRRSSSMDHGDVAVNSVSPRDNRDPTISSSPDDDDDDDIGHAHDETTRHLLVESQPRIVGGQPVTGNRPWFAHTRGGILCGATLIHRDILLTAAHCQGHFITAGIALGGSNRLQGTTYLVEKEWPHPNFNRQTYYNDIMLVKLQNPVPAGTPLLAWSDNINLPQSNSEVTVMGYGTISETGPISDTLLQVNLVVRSNRTCTSTYRLFKTSHTFCAGGSSRGGTDSCYGDSGGPTLLLSDTGIPVQVGIVSAGYGCARPNVPGFYTRVGYHAHWIRAIICRTSRVPPPSCGVGVVGPTRVTAGPTTSPLSSPSARPSPSPTAMPSTHPSALPTLSWQPTRLASFHPSSRADVLHLPDITGPFEMEVVGRLDNRTAPDEPHILLDWSGGPRERLTFGQCRAGSSLDMCLDVWHRGMPYQIRASNALETGVTTTWRIGVKFNNAMWIEKNRIRLASMLGRVPTIERSDSEKVLGSFIETANTSSLQGAILGISFTNLSANWTQDLANYLPDVNGSFSVEVYARFDQVRGRTRQMIFDLGDSSYQENVAFGQCGSDRGMCLRVWRNGTLYQVAAFGAIEEGVMTHWKCGVTADGMMWIHKNSAPLASAKGWVPAAVRRRNAGVGSSHRPGDDPLRGVILGLRMENLWDHENSKWI